jgi:hypothetical protein
MSNVAAFLMVASGALCLTGAIAAKNRLGGAASALMLTAMIDLAYTAVLPPVALSGALLIVGMVMAASLRLSPSPVRQRTAPVPTELSSGIGGVEGASHEGSAPLPSDGGDRPISGAASDAHGTKGSRLAFFPRLGRTAAVSSVITYPIMAWQVLNHGAHGGSHHAAAAGGHGHHKVTIDPSAIHTVMAGGVVVLSVLLVLCAVQAISHSRRALMLECLGMATMISVMQFLH